MKAQVAIEFIIYFSIFLLVAIAAFVVLNVIQTSEFANARGLVVKEVGNSFASATRFAVSAGPGFEYNFTYPRLIYGTPYNISIGQNKLRIVWQGEVEHVELFDLPPYSYVLRGCFSSGTLVSNQCDNTIQFKNDGTKLIILVGS